MVPITPWVEVEAAGAAGEVGDHQRNHHAQHGGRYAIEELDGHQHIRIGHGGEQEAADRQGGEPASRIGRRPQRSAWRPAQGETVATTSCGPTMQAAISTVAHSLERIVRTLPISGSMAALASWNSRIETPNTSNAGWLSRLRKPREDGSWPAAAR